MSRGQRDKDVEPDRPDVVAEDGTAWSQDADTYWRSEDTEDDDPPHREVGTIAAEHGPVHVKRPGE